MPQLNDSNYISWFRSMQHALGAKNKLTFIGGSILVLDLIDLKKCAWGWCNYLVHFWIFNSLNALISKTIVFLENATDVWNGLKECFSKDGYICVSNICIEINISNKDLSLFLIISLKSIDRGKNSILNDLF